MEELQTVVLKDTELEYRDESYKLHVFRCRDLITERTISNQVQQLENCRQTLMEEIRTVVLKIKTQYLTVEIFKSKKMSIDNLMEELQLVLE